MFDGDKSGFVLQHDKGSLLILLEVIQSVMFKQ